MVLYRAEDSLMAVVPDVSYLGSDTCKNGGVRVPLFLVRVDGVIYHTGEMASPA